MENIKEMNIMVSGLDKFKQTLKDFESDHKIISQREKKKPHKIKLLFTL